MIKVNMTDKQYTINSLKERKVELEEELQFKSNNSLNDELYEINDTLKKLGENEENNITIINQFVYN